MTRISGYPGGVWSRSPRLRSVRYRGGAPTRIPTAERLCRIQPLVFNFNGPNTMQPRPGLGRRRRLPTVGARSANCGLQDKTPPGLAEPGMPSSALGSQMACRVFGFGHIFHDLRLASMLSPVARGSFPKDVLRL